MRLSRSDLEGALSFLREAGELDDIVPFPPRLLAALAELVRSDVVRYCEAEPATGETAMYSISGSVGSDPAEDAAYWATRHENPVRVHRDRTGALGSFMPHDFVTTRQLRRTEFYADYMRPFTLGYRISLALQAPIGRNRSFVLERSHIAFGERERTLLELLQPHLQQHHRVTALRRRAHAATAGPLAGTLTERELEVLEHVATGMRNREIAHALWIAPGTVRKHLEHIYAKLDVHNRTEAAARLNTLAD